MSQPVITSLSNDRFLRAIWREPVDRTPIWMMRQAGRYLPEYRALRTRAGSFMTLCKTPELACEVTLQPLQRYDLDAAILFSDILTIPDAMGLGLAVIEGKGPVFAHPLRSPHDIQQLDLDLANLSYVYDAIRLIRQALAHSLPLIGFCGSPFTLAAYMVQGEAKAGFPLLMQLLQEDPGQLHTLLTILAKSVCAHLNEQIKAGVNAVMLFDTWGGMLDTPQYEEFSLYYIKQVIDGLLRVYHHQKIPMILFTKGGRKWLEQMADSGCDMIGLDWEVTLSEARKRVGHKVALQGNMHPACLLTSSADIRSEVAQILTSYGQGSGHVFNLGHGITPDVPPEHVTILIDAVHELSKSYHMIN